MADVQLFGASAMAVADPDLSHLTDEERVIIGNVLQRQHQEDLKEATLLRSVKCMNVCTIN